MKNSFFISVIVFLSVIISSTVTSCSKESLVNPNPSSPILPAADSGTVAYEQSTNPMIYIRLNNRPETGEFEWAAYENELCQKPVQVPCDVILKVQWTDKYGVPYNFNQYMIKRDNCSTGWIPYEGSVYMSRYPGSIVEVSTQTPASNTYKRNGIEYHFNYVF